MSNTLENSKSQPLPLSRVGEGILNFIVKVPRYPRVALTLDEDTAADAIKKVTARSAKSTWQALFLGARACACATHLLSYACAQVAPTLAPLPHLHRAEVSGLWVETPFIFL